MADCTINPGTINPGTIITIITGTINPGTIITITGTINPGTINPGTINPGTINPGTIITGTIITGTIITGTIIAGTIITGTRYTIWLKCSASCHKQETTRKNIIYICALSGTVAQLQKKNYKINVSQSAYEQASAPTFFAVSPRARFSYWTPCVCGPFSVRRGPYLMSLSVNGYAFVGGEGLLRLPE
jgi:hypothetical protein